MRESSGIPFVFVAYSRADSQLVTRLETDLQTQGVHIWIDREGIQPGTPDWEQALRTAIRAAHAVLLIASPNARNSRYVKDELRIAEMYQRPVYPIWMAGTHWMDTVPIGWGGTQYIDARDTHYQTAVHEIIMALNNSPNAALPPTVSPPTKAPNFEPRNPYKGLRAFTSEDARDFFGRDRLIDELAQALETSLISEERSNQSERLLAVVGPSGSGKSSVVMAGLLPHLQTNGLPGSKEWVYLDPIVPGVHPIEALVLALSEKLSDKSLKAIREDLEDDSARGLHLLATSLVKHHGIPGSKVILFVDQFEELFTQVVSEDERRHFIEVLMTAVTEVHGPVMLILTLRADFYDRPSHYPELALLIKEHQRLVLPMEIKDLRTVIEKPAEKEKLTFEGDLVGDLLFEVQGQIGALPLLQFTLDQLFQRRGGYLLTTQAYHEIGGIQGALANHAEATYASLPSEEHRKLARALFLRLIDPGVTEQDTTRRRATLSELSLPDPLQAEMLQKTTNVFIAARLLTTNEVAGITTIEVSHEALIREWARLSEWLSDARKDISLQQTITRDAIAWEHQQKSKDRLYRGSQLKEAKSWSDRNIASSSEVTFIRASAQYQRNARMRILLFLVGLVLVIGGFAFRLVQLQNLPAGSFPTLIVTPNNLSSTSPNCTSISTTAQCAVTLQVASSSSGSLHWTASSDIDGITFNPASGNLFPGELLTIIISAIPCQNGSFVFSGPEGTSFISVLWRCTSSSTISKNLLLNHERFKLTNIDPNGLLSNSPLAISDLEKQIRAFSALKGQRAGLVLIYAGAPTSADIERALAIVSEVQNVLKLLGQQGFVFQRTVYYDPLFILGGDPGTVEMDVFVVP